MKRLFALLGVFSLAARLLYDGASLNLPTWHGVVVREKYAQEHPEVLDAFLNALTDATQYLNSHPWDAAQLVWVQDKEYLPFSTESGAAVCRGPPRRPDRQLRRRSGRFPMTPTMPPMWH